MQHQYTLPSDNKLTLAAVANKRQEVEEAALLVTAGESPAQLVTFGLIHVNEAFLTKTSSCTHART